MASKLETVVDEWPLSLTLEWVQDLMPRARRPGLRRRAAEAPW